MIQNVDQGAGAPSDAAPPKKSGCLLRTIMAVGAVVLVIAMLLPAMRSSREPARNAMCKNNLTQIMMAMHCYSDEYGVFPPAYTVDTDGKPLHSWRTLLLPWLGAKELYESLDLSKPWDDPVNVAAFNRGLENSGGHSHYPTDLQCPSSIAGRELTTYLAIVTPNSCLQPGKGVRIVDIRDGTSNTLAVIEVEGDHAVPWYAPLDADEALVLSVGSDPNHRWPHPNGFNAAFCDGSVKFFLDTLSADSRRALISINAGDKVELP